MSEDRKARGIQDALRRLVSGLLPEQPWEDDEAFSERLERTLDSAKEKVLYAASRTSSLNEQPEMELGPHISDLIRGKLVHDNPTPDPALRYSTLFSRFTTLPVLDRKWEVLYLLYLLSNSPPTAELPRDIYHGAMPTMESVPEEEEVPLTGSFMGLHRLPDLRKGDPAGTLGSMATIATQWAGVADVGDERKPKALLLKENGWNLDPSEDTLLSAMPYTLLGVSSTSLEFAETGLTAPPAPTQADIAANPLAKNGAVDPGAGYFPTTKLILPTNLPLPIISLLHTLAEPSLLYRSLNEFVASTDDATSGLVGQSLRAAIGLELRGYLTLIGGLEGEIRRAVSMVGSGENRAIGTAGVTLKRCIVWTREATMGLRLMSVIVEQAKAKKGGQLISAIHAFATSHGDPFVHSFAERLLTNVTRPFYDMLRRWIYDGELSDPYLEFFVSEQDPALVENSEGRKGASSVWQDKYKLDEAMIPSIVTASFANKVFLIGKSLNFIRYGCGDSDWVNGYSKDTSKGLSYGDTATLESSIDEAYKITMARLISLMGDKFKLFDHLSALKRYLLLGQGDFVALLMEGLSPNLEKPANSIYRHNLTAQLEHAIRGSNAQHESQDVLRRLDARMLDPTHGDIGWDVFTLEYRVDAPVDVIITSYATRQYLKVFNMLWRIKRVEFHMGQIWRKYMTGARGVLRALDDKVGADWKVVRCVCAEMIHFVCQFQYYILYQVIEKAWNELSAATASPSCTLDDLISAHASYLNQITSKGLLSPETSTSKNKNKSSNKPPEAETIFLGLLHSILKSMLKYKEAVDGLYSYSVAEYSRRQDLGARVDARTKGGQWGMTDADYDMTTDGESRSGTPSGFRRPGSSLAAGGDLSSYNDEMLLSLRQRLVTIEAEFKELTKTLLAELAYQSDSEMRMLGVQLNFNMYYEVVIAKPKSAGAKKPATAAAAAKEKEKEDRERREREARDREAEKEREKRRERERARERQKEGSRRSHREGKRGAGGGGGASASASGSAVGRDRDGEGDYFFGFEV
ncbi:Spc98 family-domain-containing protein [Peziza echinospora]|nr:Spc98 family-domain-containing protein [Peziza echinospora]